MNVRDIADIGKTQKEAFSEETINIFFFFLQVKVEITCDLRERSRILGLIAKKHEQAAFGQSQERR